LGDGQVILSVFAGFFNRLSDHPGMESTLAALLRNLSASLSKIKKEPVSKFALQVTGSKISGSAESSIIKKDYR